MVLENIIRDREDEQKMISVFMIMYIVVVISVLINVMLIGVVFVFPDLRRAVKKWYHQRFKIRKRDMVLVTMLNDNRSSSTHFVRVDSKGLFSIDGMEDAKYTVNAEMITLNEDGFATGVWKSGNGTQINLYGLAVKSQTNAHLQDAAIKMAMAAADAGPIFELNVFLRKWVPLLVIAFGALAAGMIVVGLVVFEMAGNVSAMVGGGAILA